MNIDTKAKINCLVNGFIVNKESNKYACDDE